MIRSFRLIRLTSRQVLTGLLAAWLGAGAHAHGPDGDHHDHGATGGVAMQAPEALAKPVAPVRLEARSPSLELVATLVEGELSVLIDRHDTNEPVLGAQVTVTAGGLQDRGTFHPDHGDHAFTDERLLASLARPGRHELVFGVTVGGVTEEVRSILETPQPAAAHGEAHGPRFAQAVGAVLVAISLGSGLWWWRRRRRASRAGQVVASIALTAATALSGLIATGAGFSGPAWAGPGAHGPDGEHLDAPAAPGGADQAMRQADGSVQLPKRAQRSMGIRTAVTAQGDHPLTLTLNARVVADPQTSGQVQAAVAGRIQAPPAGLPVAGQAVRKGQVLAWLQPVWGAAEQAAQQASLTELRTNRLLAQRRVDRLLQLEGVVPDKDIEAARLELQSLREREQLTGRSLAGSQALVAPVSGVLASARVLAGQVVEPQAVLFEVVDPQRVLVEARVSDATQAAQVSGGAVLGLPDVRLDVVGAARIYRDGGVPLTFRARSTGTVLALGQPLTVVATLDGNGASRRTGVAVAAEAVVRNAANQPTVWVKTAAERFQPVVVQTQPIDGQRVLVTQGLQAGQRVVVQGASLINQVR